MSDSLTTTSARILVVDDTPANIQTLTAILKERGYQLSVATNGRQALEVIEKVHPDLVLMDVMMPEMNGYEAVSQIKASPLWQDLPIIFLSAKTDTSDIVHGFELGAVDYVAKPFNAHELLARVNTHLTLQSLRRQFELRNAELARELEVAQELLTDARRRVEGPLLGDSPAIRALRESIARQAAWRRRTAADWTTRRRSRSDGARHPSCLAPKPSGIHPRQLRTTPAGAGRRYRELTQDRKGNGCVRRSRLATEHDGAGSKGNAIPGRGTAAVCRSSRTARGRSCKYRGRA